MPRKEGTITAKDYQEPLRRPGEKRDPSTAQDGAKQSSSATNETENGQPLSNVASDLGVDGSQSSQVAEEKSTDKVSSEQKESVEQAAVSLKTEGASSDASEARNESNVEASSSTTGENVENQTETKDASNDASETRSESNVEASSSTTGENVENQLTVSETAEKDVDSKTESTDSVTTLSPFAAEFVPKAGFNLQSVVNAPEFVPESFPQQTERPMLLRQQSDKPENELMNCVKDVLFGLTQSPGELHDYAKTLVNMLKKWLSSLNSLKEVVDLIFEYSITEPNFQYIAAKLCNMLSMEENMVPENGEKFRSVLMNRCRDEHLNRESTLQNSETAVRLLGFAMFEAELFCNYRPLGESEPLRVFHRGLLEMLNTLLQNHTEECLRCICKMLKMTGFLLDDPRCMTDDQERKGKVDKVFSDVEKLSQESSVPESVKSLLLQVITLRASNWNDSTSEGTSGAYTLYPLMEDLELDELNFADDLVPVTNPEQWSEYYDDGDETASTQDTYRYYFPDQYDEEYSHEDVVGYYNAEDPEFDDEIDEEFEKFLQEQEGLQQ